jgi:hypothetical protein
MIQNLRDRVKSTAGKPSASASFRKSRLPYGRTPEPSRTLSSPALEHARAVTRIDICRHTDAQGWEREVKLRGYVFPRLPICRVPEVPGCDSTSLDRRIHTIGRSLPHPQLIRLSVKATRPDANTLTDTRCATSPWNIGLDIREKHQQCDKAQHTAYCMQPAPPRQEMPDLS